VRIDAFGLTDTGQARDSNQDAILVEGDAKLFAVADGVGGLNAGEVASGIAVGVLASALGTQSGVRRTIWQNARREQDTTVVRLGDAIRNAHARIRDAAERRGADRMASTIAALMLREDRVTIAHVGDSRVYRLREGTLAPLTRDHNALSEFIDAGVKLTEEQIAAFPYKNLITRGLGLKETVDVALGRTDVRAGDVFLLCSDGLTGEVSDAEIETVLEQCPGAEAACRALIDLANERGGGDNVSVVVVRVLE